jgi:uncharacterized protein YfaS (alpha-2-macroglobulin family)
MKLNRIRVSAIGTALLAIASVAIVESFQGTRAASGQTAVATYSKGILQVTIPYHAPHVGMGQLTVELLDPEDQVLVRSERRVDVGAGESAWQEDLKLSKPMATEDLVWHRLRYRFAYTDQTNVAAVEGTESLSQILRMPVLHILGQRSYLTGGQAAVRVVVTDSKNESIPGASSVRIDLDSRVLFTGRLNSRGTTQAQFRFPAGIVGSRQLRYVVDTPIGSTEFTQPVQLEDKASILLTTEKPIYQPGQTIHVRALALDRSNHEAAAGRKLTFELEDSRGNKVFKKATQTDKFGIASTEFGLADEVNLGTYHLRALMDANTAEIALNIERYVLPKFKVALDFAEKGAKHGYRPGDHVTGTVRTNYFFGKPVDGGEITVKASGMDVTTFETGSVHGKTDSEGAYRFDLQLPIYFAGRPLNGGAARVLIEATVKDSVGHAESRGEPITVSESPLIITAVPEGGTLIPNLENQLFILTSYADGKPAVADLKVQAAGTADQSVTTDQGGVAVIRLNAGIGTETLQIDADDKSGNHASSSVQLKPRTGSDQILLRTERAVYRAGDRIQLRVFSTKERGTAYVDVIKEGQTVLTRDLDIKNGRAELTLIASPDLAGTLDINAYLFGSDSRPVADHRLVFVQPADELKIEAAADAAVYKPGDDARIRFRVTNTKGEGVQAALGLQVVDEAVFALAEKQPGFAKVFFYLEQEALKPRYEIHSIGMPEIVEPVAQAQARQRDRAARALFAATEMVSANKFETELGRTVPMAKYVEYTGRYQTRFLAQVRQLSASDLVKAGGPEVRDAWGTNLRVEDGRWPQKRFYLVRSAGPDKRFDTGDDLGAYVEVQPAGTVVIMERFRLQLGVFAGERPLNGRVDGIGLGFGGGVAGGLPMAAPVMAARASLVAERAAVVNTATVLKDKAEPSAPRVRSYFPEALYINPEIITDQNGVASISIPLADSITTWRMAMLASTARGALGSGTSSIKVFQDFFVDLDLPITLTQGDRVSIPVAVYNYSGASADVSLKLQADDWFSLVQDIADKTVAVDSGRVGSSQFTLEAKRIGKFKLTLSASMHGLANRADIVVREIEVVPDGREQTMVFNGRLETAVQHDLNFPAASIPDASKIFVRLYPGPLSQVIEGMDAILRMPGGCFEQTSSSTYPNILALDYMKRTKKLTPEVHAKAEGYIANGYQRLLTFEVPGGGFSWFGNAPANKILTAYGLMEFYDMSKVHDVDPKVIQRTQQWLAGQQQADGSWKPDASFINEGATNRYNSDVLRITAYIAWSLENTGYQGPAIEKARQFVENHMNARPDAYTLAVLANFAADYGKDRDFTGQAMQLLLDARTEKDEQAWWTAEETSVYARGASASVETTGLAVQALLKWGQGGGTTGKALTYLASKKDASGTWGTTQATIMALRALLLSTEKGSADVRGTLEVSLNGKPAETLVLTPENNDLLHQFALKGVDSKAANAVAIKFNGKGGLAYQVVGRYFVPWTEKPVGEPLSISVAYDRTRLAQDDIATAVATVRNNLTKTANMVMVDLGIPPGFELLSEDLQAYRDKSAGAKSGRLEKFSLTATQAILYFDSIAPGDTVTLRFHLRAKFPIRARTFQSRIYEYYDPEVSSVARPVQLEVRKR